MNPARKVELHKIESTRQELLAGLDHSEWDVVILGAGVAGAAAAILASRSGFRTLLVDAKPFPREKVCGGCLNRRAQAALERLGVLENLHKAGAVPITELHLQVGKTSVVWKIPALLSVRRSTLDGELVRSAIDSGATFFDKLSGFVIPRDDEIPLKKNFRQVVLQDMEDPKNEKIHILSHCILIADGLSRSSLRLENDWDSEIQSDSRIGVQRMVEASQFAMPSGRKTIQREQLHMIVSSDGYVGLSHTDGNLVDVAGAIDPKSIAKRGGIAAVVSEILGGEDEFHSVDEKSNNGSEKSSDQWSATPTLTRTSTRVANDRVFLLGDSIGYVEPFTGEGMSWALASAEAVMPIVSRTIGYTWSESNSKDWTSWVDSQRRGKQRTCWWISRQLRRLSVAAWTLRLCNSIYPIRAALIKKVTS